MFFVNKPHQALHAACVRRSIISNDSHIPLVEFLKKLDALVVCFPTLHTVHVSYSPEDVVLLLHRNQNDPDQICLDFIHPVYVIGILDPHQCQRQQVRVLAALCDVIKYNSLRKRAKSYSLGRLTGRDIDNIIRRVRVRFTCKTFHTYKHQVAKQLDSLLRAVYDPDTSVCIDRNILFVFES